MHSNNAASRCACVLYYIFACLLKKKIEQIDPTLRFSLSLVRNHHDCNCI